MLPFPGVSSPFAHGAGAAGENGLLFDDVLA
jgi:hypothetical protein